MGLLRRVTALVMSALILQLALAGSGYACGAHDTETAATHEGMPTQQSGDACDVRSAPNACDVSGPGAVCQPTSPCALALLVTQSGSSVVLAQPGPQAMLVLAPSTRSIAPEPPPPRA